MRSSCGCRCHRQRRVATWAEFQQSVVYDATAQWQKDWKHVLVQKMVTLNTCYDVACLTFQLRHTQTFSFQSHQYLKERNKPSVRRKSFTFHKLMWWYFHVWWWSGLQFVSFWDNVNNEKCVWIILLKITFWDFPRWIGYIWQVKWTNL